MIRRTVLEWGTLPYGDGEDQIPQQVADRIAAVAAASPLAGRGGGGIVEHGRKGLTARGVVGVIAAEGCVLEILPKIDFPGEDNATSNIRRRLVDMLAVALDMKIDVGDITALDWQRETLLELLIRLFARKLGDAVRQGMPRRYVERADDLSALRGRLNVTRQYTALVAQPGRLACGYDNLSANMPLNQIMKAAVVRLASISRTSANQRLLRELAFTYAEINDIPVKALGWDQVALDRTNNRWRELINLARLLLGERFQTTSAGGVSGFSLLFEMNVLFEEYVARTLGRALAGEGLRVVSQGGRLYCLESPQGRGLFQTKPDILIKRGKVIVQVIDTKWKRIGMRTDDPKKGVSQADVYQMMAYGQIYNCDQLTLLYPHHSALVGPDGPREANRINPSDDQQSRRLHISTLDVSSSVRLKDRLRKLVAA